MHAALSAALLLTLDIPWVMLFMGPRYKKMVAAIQQGDPMRASLWKAAVSYALMVIGMTVFVSPAFRQGSVAGAVGRAALFGAVVYGIFDFTAAAVFGDWDMKLAVIDVAWGSFVFAAASLGAYMIDHKIIPHRSA